MAFENVLRLASASFSTSARSGHRKIGEPPISNVLDESAPQVLHYTRTLKESMVMKRLTGVCALAVVVAAHAMAALVDFFVSLTGEVAA